MTIRRYNIAYSLTVVLLALFSVNGFAQIWPLPVSNCNDYNPYTPFDLLDSTGTCIGYCIAPNDGLQPPGTVCDDGLPWTGADLMDSTCVCQGIGGNDYDCAGNWAGPELPGTPCNDGDPNTLNDHWDGSCNCVGQALDCLGAANGPALIGVPCNDGHVFTASETWHYSSFTGSTCWCTTPAGRLGSRVFIDVDEDSVFTYGIDAILQRPVTVSDPSGTTVNFTSGFSIPSLIVDTNLYTVSIASSANDSAYWNTQAIGLYNYWPYAADFPVKFVGNLHDIRVDLIEPYNARPGFSSIYHVFVTNQADSLVTSASLEVEMAPFHLVDTIYQPHTLVGTTVTFLIDSIKPFETQQYALKLTADPAAPLGLNYSVSSTLFQPGPDDVPLNDADTVSNVVVGAFDPNDKLVSPQVLTPDDLANGKKLNYRIRFQNTGTFQAENVRIEDQLPLELDENTFEFVGSSHPCTWTNDNGDLTFYFNNIQLPDSNANEPASHGFVDFRITPASGLLVGDTISNSAAIYFDFNAPVITDPVDVMITTTTDVLDQPTEIEQARLWPNPNSNGMVHVELPQGHGTRTIRIYDAQLRLVHSQAIHVDANGNGLIYLQHLQVGLYFVGIEDGVLVPSSLSKLLLE